MATTRGKLIILYARCELLVNLMSTKMLDYLKQFAIKVHGNLNGV